MKNEEIKMIIRIIGIIGVIFSILALVLPWGDYFYTWGYSNPYSTSPFYIDFFIHSAPAESIFFAIAMIVIFVLTLITFILGIIAVVNMDKNFKNMVLSSGIICIFNFIFYIVAVTIASGGSFSYGTYSMYSVGFIFILISGILFFVSYFMQMAFNIDFQPKPRFQQIVYQPPVYQQPSPAQTVTPTEIQKGPPASQKQTKSLKFCPSCGNELKPGAKFCTNCGNKLS